MTVECAHSDRIWACGIRLNEEDRHNILKWIGQNLLGFALMEVRDSLEASTNYETFVVCYVDSGPPDVKCSCIWRKSQMNTGLLKK